MHKNVPLVLGIRWVHSWCTKYSHVVGGCSGCTKDIHLSLKYDGCIVDAQLFFIIGRHKNEGARLALNLMLGFSWWLIGINL